jgi:predicted metalloprotease with PDZ domain
MSKRLAVVAAAFAATLISIGSSQLFSQQREPIGYTVRVPAPETSYRVFGNQRSVTTNYVDGSYGVLNGAPTFMTLIESGQRPHDVHLEPGRRWTCGTTATRR